MREAAPPVLTLSLPLSADFVERCAERIVEDCRARLPDLSSIQVVLPNLALAPRLCRALAAAAGSGLLLPRLSTLPRLAAAAGIGGQPDSLRRITLYRLLRERNWFPDNAVWEICAELIALFDELNARAVGLPQDEAEFLARLERAYAARGSQPLRFEAEVVHRLWLAEAAGPPSRQVAESMALAALAGKAAAPLYLLCEHDPRPVEADFCRVWALRQPVTLFQPRRDAVQEAPMRALNFAWPPGVHDDELSSPLMPSLIARAEAARAAFPLSPLAGRLRLIGAASLEAEAATAAAEVKRWLAAGHSAIALVAADRVAARRTRALLERDGILARDETGWKLSTTRAAALIDAWLEVAATDAYHRALLDLVKSPFVFGDLPEAALQAGLLQLESGLARYNLASGLSRYETALARQGDCAEALELLRRVAAARRVLPRGGAFVADWLAALTQSLAALGALDGLARDGAGATLLELLRARQEELAAVPPRLTFNEWREWLDREFENAAFVDQGIDSPLVMTHLAATRLRRFDAAILIGADRGNLASVFSGAVFGNQAVRADLGLPLPAEAAARLRDDLAGLIVSCGEVTATWQILRGDEANLLCPELDLLSVLHAHAWGDGLTAAAVMAVAAPPPVSVVNSAVNIAANPGTAMPRPAAPQRTPLRLSTSAYASLVACPYQFFVRRMLGLAEADEVSEAFEKRDYGEFVHRILTRFHAAHPRLADLPEAALAADLEAISRALFAPRIAENFLEHAWLARWLDCVPGYIAWQKAREAAGWRYAGGELARERILPLPGGGEVTLHGRLDRLDVRDDAAEAVLDYKTQNTQNVRRRLADAAEEVQLACYALLQGGQVTEAAYVALDGETPAALPLPEVQAVARAQGARLTAAVAALRAGAALPAHGAETVCAWCEARGLCRRDYHAGIQP
ncbi:MAG: PD-(D/E)XK nuclease family protein [Zoogloeaceae bacterium]|jgi:ATP-dependent helicase/nuclease subunit B|nr:PD-(D/E)XK nuclease family protein [Zoogloeaceae bacterium]